ncbi:MAG: hypothetical protein QNJ40_21945 [Xanthomonadales bacterium]|nr:hypothetical protein [Xanthomonadales bacterium]
MNRKTLLLLGLALAGLSLGVIGQNTDPVTDPAGDSETPAADQPYDDEPEVLEQELEEPRLIPMEPEPADPAPESTPESGSGPEQTVQEEGVLPPPGEPEAGGRDVKASMERFVPSEKISEDRSVAFPNDI